MANPIKLPPLDTFTREELVELVRILHGGLLEAHRDYRLLSETAQRAIDTMRTIATAASSR